MVPVCNPAGDPTLCRVSMTSRTRENKTHKLFPSLNTSSQDSITVQEKTQDGKYLWCSPPWG